MYKIYLTHFMCADDSIYTFCSCLNAYTRRGAQVTFFFRRTNTGTSESSEWWFGVWFIKKHLRNILGLYGKNTKKISHPALEKMLLKIKKTCMPSAKSMPLPWKGHWLSHHIIALGVVIVGRFQCITRVLFNNISLSSISP